MSNNEIREEKQEECIELKNIKYKTMLLSGVNVVETVSSSNLTNLEEFLENEKSTNQNEHWTKLDKTMKTKKIFLFVNDYSKENNISSEESAELFQFLKDCLDKKKFQRAKDINYDKITGTIKSIPALLYTKDKSKHFTLKNIEKRLLTSKNLPPIKKNTTKPLNLSSCQNNLCEKYDNK
jgi:hypothetical protein